MSPPSLQRRRWLIAGLSLPLTAFAQKAQPGAPVMVEGQSYPREVTLAGTRLQLNGTGIREVAWFKGYAAGLYLARRATTAAQVVALPGPKRLQMRMLQSVPAGEFVKAFNKGMARNSTPEQVDRLMPRMALFEGTISAIGEVRKFDVVDLDYVPETGMVMIQNGKPRGEPIAGDDFYGALLRAFVGDKPYDIRMRTGLLAGGA